MSVQTKYGFATAKASPVASTICTTIPLTPATTRRTTVCSVSAWALFAAPCRVAMWLCPLLPGKAADFEGVIVNGFSNQHDLEGVVSILNNQNIGVMRKGRIWVSLAEDAEPEVRRCCTPDCGWRRGWLLRHYWRRGNRRSLYRRPFQRCCPC